MSFVSSSQSRMNPQEFRMFVAASLQGMPAVQNELLHSVIPKLRQQCNARGVQFVDLDLRWGITEAQLRGRKPVAICLDEITMRSPVVLVIVGDRGKEGISRDDDASTEQYPWLYSTVSVDQDLTEFELVESLLDNPLAGGSVYWYLQNALSTSQEEGAVRCERLKQRIRQSSLRVRNYDDAALLGCQILNDCLRELDRRHPVQDSTSLLEAERRAHTLFAESRRGVYEPIGDYLQQLSTCVSLNAGRAVLIAGVSGCGKSTLLACWAQKFRARNPESIVIEHYVGASSPRPGPTNVLRHILTEIQSRGAIATPVPNSEVELVEALKTWPAYCLPSQVIIVIDALDQMEEAAQNLTWLPVGDLLPNVKLIVSTIDGGAAYAELCEQQCETIYMEELTDNDRWKILRAYLARGNSRLSEIQIRALSSNTVATTPLFLRTIVEELHTAGSFKDTGTQLRDYLTSASLEELFQKVLLRLESQPGYRGRLVKDVVTLISASRNGLTEQDLLLLTRAKPEVLRILIERLRSFLIERDGLLRFFHDQFSDAVRNLYMPECGKQRKRHEWLARFFSEADITQRSAQELPWQWEAARRWTDLGRCVTKIEMFLALSTAEHRTDLLRYWRKMVSMGNLADLYRTALADSNVSVTQSVDRIIEIHCLLGDAFNDGALYNEAVTILEPVLVHPVCRNIIPTAHLLLSHTYQQLGRFDEAEALLKVIVDDVDGDESSNGALLEALDSLGKLYYARQDYLAAQQTLARALTLCTHYHGKEHPLRIGILSTIGAIAHARGNYKAAEHLLRTVLTASRNAHGELHPTTSSALSNLAASLREQHRLQEAIELVRNALTIDEQIFGMRHPQTALKLNNLGTLLRLARQYPEAEEQYLAALKILVAVYGEIHPDVASCRNNMATLFNNIEDRYEDAEREFREAAGIRRVLFGAEAVITINTELNLAWLLAKCGRFYESIELYNLALPRKKRALGNDHPKTLQSVRNYRRVVAAAQGKGPLETNKEGGG